MNFLHLYTRFAGRISRKPYWLGTILLFAITIVAVIAFNFARVGETPGTAEHAAAMVLFTAALLWAHSALMAKRLHDRNRPTWWLAFFLVPVLVKTIKDTLSIPDDPLQSSALDYTLNALILVVGCWFLIELGILRGTRGQNQHGPDPLAKSA